MFYKNIGDISSQEALLYNYWTTTLTLLDQGLPWDYIEECSPSEITMILAILMAKKERESELGAKGI